MLATPAQKVGERPPASLEEATDRAEWGGTAGFLGSISGNTSDNTQIDWAAPENTRGNSRQKSGAISLDDLWKTAGNSVLINASRGIHPSYVEIAGAGNLIPGCFQLEGQEMRHITSDPIRVSRDSKMTYPSLLRLENDSRQKPSLTRASRDSNITYTSQPTSTPLSVDNLSKTRWHGTAYADRGGNTTLKPIPLNPTAAEFIPNEVGVSEVGVSPRALP